MERAIIKGKEFTILLYLNDDNSFSGFKYYDDGRVEPIDYSVFKYFDMFKLSNNYAIIPEIGKYLVVLDKTTNFKHYFLNGVEDYKMLFYNNGESAIDYMEEDGEKNKERKTPFRKFKDTFVTILVSIEILAASLIGNVLVVDNHGAARADGDITIDEVLSMIDNTKGLPSGGKKILKQSGFFEALLPYFNSNNLARDNLKTSLNNIVLNFLTEEEMELALGDVDIPSISGFHNSERPNELNVKIGLSLEKFIDVLSHEFIHLCQCPNLEYNAIYEAMAEQLSLEFFPLTTIDAYSDEVSQLRKLMDIIGAKPFVEYYTTGSMTSIENKIKPLLGEEKYEEFLSTLVKVKIPSKSSSNYLHSIILEKERVDKLDSFINEMAEKTNVEFRNHSIDSSREVKYNYFNNQPMIRNLLSGSGYDLRTLYDMGIIGFSVEDFKGNLYRDLDPDETISRYNQLNEDNYDIVVTYNPEGESTWTWEKASISLNNEEKVWPTINIGTTMESYKQFCDNTDTEPDELFDVNHKFIDMCEAQRIAKNTRSEQMMRAWVNMEGNKRADEEQSKTIVFWKNSKQLEININGSSVIIEPDLALQVFGNNMEVKEKIDQLLNVTTMEVRDELNKPVEGAMLGTISPRNSIILEYNGVSNEDIVSSTTIKSIYPVFMDSFSNYYESTPNNDVEEYKRRYDNLREKLGKDFDYERTTLAMDIGEGLTAEDIYNKNIMRTWIEKKGYSFIFMHRLQEEAYECGIENYSLCEVDGDDLKWYVLCADNGGYYVSNPGNDFGHPIDDGESSSYVQLADFISKHPIEETEEGKTNYYVVEGFRDNSKPINELKAFPLTDFIEARELYRAFPETVLSEGNLSTVQEDFGVPIR